MQSPFYGYYYISKDNLSDYWSTKEIEQFILNSQNFVSKSLEHFIKKKYFYI